MFDRLFDPLVQRMLHPPRFPSRPLPPEVAESAEDVTIQADRVPIKGWLLRPVGYARGSAVLVHGWGQDAVRMVSLATHIAAAGIAALLIDLPGHGRSGAVTTYNAALMVDDLRATRDWVAARVDLRALPAGIVGFSFGGLGAYVAAARDPRWAALVAIAAPTGAMAAARIYLDGKGLPGRWLDGTVRRWFQRTVGVDPAEYDAERTLAAIRVPVMIVHGESDEVVPVSHAERLNAIAPAGLRTLLRVPDARHSSVLGDDAVGARVAEFLRSSLGAAREGS
jgi:putative redox protein